MSMVPLGPLDIYTSEMAMPPSHSSSFVNFISGKTRLMYVKKIFTSVRFKIAKASST